MIIKHLKFIYGALEAAFIGLMCFWIGGYISQLFNDGKGYIDGLWCMISALVVLQSLAYDVITAATARVIGTIIASIISGFLCWWLGYHYFVIALSVGLSAYAMNVMNMSDGVRIATATAAVITGVIFSVLVVFISYQLHIRKFKAVEVAK